jgi:peptidoglycan/LPS O-acetylase OafA/YrhL
VIGARGGLGYRPELDGLRGIAILLVLGCHIDGDELTGAGTVGVTIFFTISGFLITTLLLEEHRRTGRIELLRFFHRRALRLLPGLTAVVLVVGALSYVVDTGVTAGSALAAVCYSSNYWTIAHHGARTWLTHTWSLSVEEQFYILWPLLLLGALRLRGRRGVLWAAGVGAVLSLGWRSWLMTSGAEPDRVGYGFDTCCGALLVGCWLSAYLVGRTDERAPSASWSWLLVLLAPLTLWFPFTYQLLAPALVPVVTAVVIAVAVRGGGVSWLRARWLTLVGRRSYGLYLWHYPIIAAVFFHVAGRPWLLSTGILAGLSWLAAVLSWHLVEAPFLRLKGPRVGEPSSRQPAGPVTPA